MIYHIHPSYPWHCGTNTTGDILTTNEVYVNCPHCLKRKMEN